MLDFNNTKIAFEAKSDSELRNAYILFNTVKYPFLVKLVKFGTNLALKIRFPLAWIVKPTLFKQFVGGETLQDCEKVITRLMDFRVRSTLDYSAESEQTPEEIQKTMEETLRLIDHVKNSPNIAYAVFKPSTIITDALLSKASEHPETLTEKEKEEYEAYHQRFLTLCRKAYDKDIRILVDAEDYCFQNSIDRMTNEAMQMFNKKRAIVFATLQMYRHDRLPYLHRIFEDAKEKGYIAGIKFVRGAYMEHERSRAEAMGYPDPICKDKQMTDDNFNKGVEFVIENLEHFELFMGTHNEKSNYLLAELIDKKGLKHDDSRIFFAQLLGMSDNISFNLAHEGYNVTKYVPYASVRKVLPYLLRRAEENTSVTGQTTRELNMLRLEKKRRKNLKWNK